MISRHFRHIFLQLLLAFFTNDDYLVFPPFSLQLERQIVFPPLSPNFSSPNLLPAILARHFFVLGAAGPPAGLLIGFQYYAEWSEEAKSKEIPWLRFPTQKF